MMGWFRRLMAAVGTDVAAAELAEGSRPLTPAVSQKFSAGQIWRYENRPGEDASRVIIGKVEQAAEIGTIIHVKIIGLSLKGQGETASVITHAPVAEAQVAASVVELTDEVANLDGLDDGYASWCSAFLAGKAGVFTITLSEIVEYMERVFAQ